MEFLIINIQVYKIIMYLKICKINDLNQKKSK